MPLEEMAKEEGTVQDLVFCCCRSLGDSPEFQLLIPDYIDINSNFLDQFQYSQCNQHMQEQVSSYKSVNIDISI